MNQANIRQDIYSSQNTLNVNEQTQNITNCISGDELSQNDKNFHFSQIGNNNNEYQFAQHGMALHSGEQENILDEKQQINQFNWQLFNFGIDLTNLGLNLNDANDEIIAKFQSPFSDQPVRQINSQNFPSPSCYSLKTVNLSSLEYFKKFPEETLFYIFYNVMDKDLQFMSVKELYEKGWQYHSKLQTFFKDIKILGVATPPSRIHGKNTIFSRNEPQNAVAQYVRINASYFSMQQTWSIQMIKDYVLDESCLVSIEEFKTQKEKWDLLKQTKNKVESEGNMIVTDKEAHY